MSFVTGLLTSREIWTQTPDYSYGQTNEGKSQGRHEKFGASHQGASIRVV